MPQTYRIPQTLWTTPNSCQVPPQARFPVWTTVRTGSEQLNHPELMRNYPVILVPSRAQWFKQVRKSWTTPNSWEIILWSLFPLELKGSARFGRGGTTFLPLSSRGNKDHRIISREFGVVQLFRTCSNYSSTQETRPAVELDMSSG